MRGSYRLADWSLHSKMILLVVVASLVPLSAAAYWDVRETRRLLLADTEELLAARAGEVAGQLDIFHEDHLRSAGRVALLPGVRAFCAASSETAARLRPVIEQIMRAERVTDSHVLTLALLNSSGTIIVAPEPQMIGLNLAAHPFVINALAGQRVPPSVHLPEPQIANVPAVAYAEPVRNDEEQIIGLFILWVDAVAIFDRARASRDGDDLRATATLLDENGVRLASTEDTNLLFHPAGQLPQSTIAALVKEERFGKTTETLLSDVRSSEEQFVRSLAPSVEPEMFHARSSEGSQSTYQVARRLRSVSWTLFYFVPEGPIDLELDEIAQERGVFAAAIAIAALIIGSTFARVFIGPVRSLVDAMEQIAAGDLTSRIPGAQRRDELGRMTASFNAMAERIETQSLALARSRDQLEGEVQKRTRELQETATSLRGEVAERRRGDPHLRNLQ